MIIYDDKLLVIGSIETIFGMFEYMFHRNEFQKDYIDIHTFSIDDNFNELLSKIQYKSKFDQQILLLPLEINMFITTLEFKIEDTIQLINKNQNLISNYNDINHIKLQQIIFKHLNELGWDYIYYFQPDLLEIQLKIHNQSDKIHILTIKISNNYPHECPTIVEMIYNINITYEEWKLHNNLILIKDYFMKSILKYELYFKVK